MSSWGKDGRRYQVAVVGAGAIGSPLAFGLSRLPWVSRLTLVDGDRVALSNLPRQPWYAVDDLGRFKVAALAEALKDEVPLKVVPAYVESEGAELLSDVDLVVEGTDNWPARLAVAAASRRAGIPWVFASAVGEAGMTHLFLPDAPCLHCLFGEVLQEGPRCMEIGVLSGVTLAVAGEALVEAENWVQGGSGPWPLVLVDARRPTRRITTANSSCPHWGSLGGLGG